MATNNIATAAPLTPFIANYKATMGNLPLSGKASYQLQLLPNGTYQLKIKAKNLFVQFQEQVSFNWQPPCASQPIHYQYQRQAFGRSKQFDIEFNWDQKYAKVNQKDHPHQYQIPEQAIDRLSSYLMISCLLKQKQAQLYFVIAEKNDLDEYNFSILNPEIIQTPLGELHTIPVMRQRSHQKRVTKLWFAPKLDFLLVQLKQKDQSKTYTLTLNQYKINQ